MPKRSPHSWMPYYSKERNKEICASHLTCKQDKTALLLKICFLARLKLGPSMAQQSTPQMLSSLWGPMIICLPSTPQGPSLKTMLVLRQQRFQLVSLDRFSYLVVTVELGESHLKPFQSSG